MRTTVCRAFHRTPGGDLLVGVLVTCLGVFVALGVGSVAATSTIPPGRVLVAWLGTPLVALIGVPTLVGIYSRVGRDETDDGGEDGTGRIAGVSDGRLRETVQLTAVTLRRRGSTLLAGLGVAVLASLIVGILVTLVLHAVVLTLLTVAGYVSYALGYGQLLSAVRVFHVSGVLVGLGLSVGVFSVRFFDCVVCWTDAGPVASVCESLRFTRVRPLTVLGYALVTTVMFVIPAAAFIAAETLHETLAFGTLVVLTATSVALHVNFHARVCHCYLLPVCCGTDSVEELAPTGRPESPGPSYAIRDRPLVANPLSMALALVLVTGLLVGSGTVRALDVRPVDAPSEPGPIKDIDDAAALVGSGAVPLAAANHRAVETSYAYNESKGRWVDAIQFRYEYDHQQRRYLVSVLEFDSEGEPTFSHTAYYSTKQTAFRWLDEQGSQPVPEVGDHSWHKRTAGNWIIYSVSGTELLDESSESVSVSSRFFEQDWRVVDDSSDTITLAVEGPDAVPMNERGYGPIESAEVEVTLDRETGYVVEVSQTLYREDEDLDPIRVHVEFENWGDHVVDRPDEFDVRAVEWVWGVASY